MQHMSKERSAHQARCTAGKQVLHATRLISVWSPTNDFVTDTCSCYNTEHPHKHTWNQLKDCDNLCTNINSQLKADAFITEYII